MSLDVKLLTHERQDRLLLTKCRSVSDKTVCGSPVSRNGQANKRPETV